MERTPCFRSATGVNLREFTATDTVAAINLPPMVGATGVAGGTAGLVPAPAAGDNVKVLSGAGTYIAAGGSLTAQTLGDAISGATAKSDPVDADMLVVADSAAGNIAKKVTIGELKTEIGAGAAVTVKDEGITLTSALASLDFVGAGVTATNTSGAVTVTIPQTGVGKHSVFIPAGSFIPQNTNGSSSGLVELATNKQMLYTLDFDAAAQEHAQFHLWKPKSWNESTVTFQVAWSHAATATNFGVVWALQSVAISDNETMDMAWGTAVTVTDTGGTTDRLYHSPESTAVTIAGSPAELDMVLYRLYRVVADAGDTMAIDARLHGIKLFITTNAGTDA